MQVKAHEEGRITDECMGRMLSMLTKACMDGADGIILTCTLFSAYADVFCKLFSVPIVSPDRDMLEEAAQKGGRTAILCTFPSTVESATELYRSYLRKYGRPDNVTSFLVDGAYEAMQRQEMDLYKNMTLQKIREIDGDFDTIVLAQVSMSEAVLGINDFKAEILTSPGSAYRALIKKIKAGGQTKS